MRPRKIVVYGDGRHELGRQPEYDGSENLPALPRLVHRLLGAPANVRYTCRLFRDIRPVQGRGLAYEQKAKGAILESWEDFDGLVILIDRDRRKPTVTLRPLADGREAMQTVRHLPAALGVAVETFDAWMILDGKAIARAGGDSSYAHSDPEKLDRKEGTGRHPKEVAAKAFGGKTGLGEKYAIVATHVDLNLLRRGCPEGFAPFAGEVESRIGPVARPQGGAAGQGGA